MIYKRSIRHKLKIVYIFEIKKPSRYEIQLPYLPKVELNLQFIL